jgi:uncharacterized FlaG/YvyC family protein
MNIDITKNISIAKTQAPSSHEKRPVKATSAPHINEEVVKNAEKMKQGALLASKLSMDYNADIDRVIITVIDSHKQEVVLQIPNTDSITFMQRFQQTIKGTVNRKV